ncbi:9219_t:CDS:10, partial [Gigaspora margarita]
NQRCPHCSSLLLTGKLDEFCCKRGKRILPLLPAYPMDINSILSDPKSSNLSQKLNALFLFIAISVEANTPNHSIHWYLYDEQERYYIAHNNGENLPYTAALELCENTSTSKIAAIMYTNNTIDVSLRSWHVNNSYNLSQIDWYRYHLLHKQQFLFFGRLTCEYLVDMYSRVEEEQDFDDNSGDKGNLHLPASFMGSKKWCSAHVANTFALARSTIVAQAFHFRLGKLKDLLRDDPELPVDQIDKIIFAEMPYENGYLREMVKKYMLYRQQHSFRCLRNGICIYQYPKLIVSATYIDEKGYVHYHRRTQEDPIRTESSRTTNSIYQTAGDSNSSSKQQLVNEFKDYIKGRYLLAPEAAWRIFHYHITSMDLPVQALPIYLLNVNISQYSCSSVSSVSLLSDFLEKEQNGMLRKIVHRQTTNKITQIILVTLGAGEIFYLRCILIHRAAQTWNEETARKMGLFLNEHEGMFIMKEAIKNFFMLVQLHFLFVQLILDGAPALNIWQKFSLNLLADIGKNFYNDQFSTTNITLQQIASMLRQEAGSVPVTKFSKFLNRKADLIRESILIVCDKLPMANKAILDCIDLFLKQICNKNKPFGGKPFIGVEDFRQQESDVSLGIFQTTHDIDKAISFLYLKNLLLNYAALQKRAFLSPCNFLVNDFNNKILNVLPGIACTYFSYDVVKENDEVLNNHPIATPDYLAQLTHPRIPNHKLNLKVGQRLVEVILLNNNKSNTISKAYLLPQINFYFQLDYCSWTIFQKQFPLRLAYSTTFNSCQGLTLNHVVIDLRTHVFVHGQLYTAISRVRNRNHCLILLAEDKIKSTKAETASINDEDELQMDQEMTEIAFEENDLVTENKECKKNNQSRVHGRGKKNKNKNTRNTRKTRNSKVINIS